MTRSRLFGTLPPHGFTFVELMITLSVTSILLMTAIPNFTSAMLNQGVKASAFDLVSALGYTRGEAIKRNRPVVLRALNNDWRQVWFACAPDASASTTERGRCNSGEIELRNWPHPEQLAISAASTADGSVAVTAVTFRSDGRVTTGALFNLCDQTGKATVIRRLIRLDASGRPNLKYGGTCAAS